MRPQTIQIYLPGGDPRGVRIAEITTRIVQVVEVPRSLLADFLKTPESRQVAVYFLVGQDTATADPSVYVGQTSDMPTRFLRHNQDKDFWERALVLLSKTQSLTQTHALFLEWHCLQEVKNAGRYGATNGNNACRPYTPAPLEADCHEVFDTARTLLATLGHPLFEPVAPTSVNEQPEMFFCTSVRTNGRGFYTEEGFVVLAGSTGRRENVASIQGTAAGKFREQLLASGILREDGDRVVVPKDHLFNSPSAAALALYGRSTNGWVEWKTAEGKTLHEVKRSGVK